jgi:hypothetical protein
MQYLHLYCYNQMLTAFLFSSSVYRGRLKVHHVHVIVSSPPFFAFQQHQDFNFMFSFRLVVILILFCQAYQGTLTNILVKLFLKSNPNQVLQLNDFSKRQTTNPEKTLVTLKHEAMLQKLLIQR